MSRYIPETVQDRDTGLGLDTMECKLELVYTLYRIRCIEW